MGAPETVGQRIRRERIKAGLTQRQLAAAAGVSVPHISKIEADRDTASDDVLVKIAKALKMDPDELLLVARRVPQRLLDEMAARPAEATLFLRRWDSSDERKSRTRRPSSDD